MKLYHATSEFAWKEIQRVGFIGVTEDILLSYTRDIFDQLAVPKHKREMFYKRTSANLEEYAPNGSVSFFPDYSGMMEYARLLGRQLGEAFGLDTKNAVKYASRVTKTDYRDNLAKISFLNQTHIPVMLTVDIPNDLIDNTNDIGTKTELYTVGVVPLEYVVEMKYI